MAGPNVVFILADDMGYGDIGAFSDGSSKTPQIDRLTSEGVCLTQHYSASPVCAPARAALMTGRYPQRTGVVDVLEIMGLERLKLDEVTMADFFRNSGYSTGLIGKWHLGAFDKRYHPNSRGFDEFAGFCGGWSDYYDWRLDYNGAVRKADGRYLTDVFTEEAVQYIKRHRKEPFFLHLTYNAPHIPFQCPKEDLALFSDTGRYSKGVSYIYGMIHRMDKGIGRVLDEIKKQGLEEDTIVIFSSDNGPRFRGANSFSDEFCQGRDIFTDDFKPDHEMCTVRYNAGLRGCKGLVYEGGIKVPAIIRWPAGLERGTMNGELVHFADWLPTLSDACGIEPVKGPDIDGISVLPYLQGDLEGRTAGHFWQFTTYRPLPDCNAAARQGRWKLVRPAVIDGLSRDREDIEKTYDSKGEAAVEVVGYDNRRGRLEPGTLPQPQLFDLDKDPLEKEDISLREPEKTVELINKLDSWFESVEKDRLDNKI